MKQSSIDKLSRVYNFLCDELRPDMAELIKEVLRAEGSEKSDSLKFNIYNFVADPKCPRPQMTGVFYDGEWRVASDLHILIAEKGVWPEELQGKIVAQDGSFIKGTYPKWQSILPKSLKDYEAHEIDITKVEATIKEYRLQYKAEYGKSKKWHNNWTINVDGTYFKAEFIWMLLTAGVEKLYIDKNIKNRVAYFETSYTKGFIMQVLND